MKAQKNRKSLENNEKIRRNLKIFEFNYVQEF